MPAFNDPPANRRSTPTPFRVSVPDAQLSDLKTLLHQSKIAPETYENVSTDGRFGISREWLIRTKAQWEEWDWRACEARINSFPNFTLPVRPARGETLSIHFVALFSQRPDAVPVLFLHGWPGSFMEFFSILDLLSRRHSPATLPYHVVVPSLPGYAFSSPPPRSRDFGLEDVARAMDALMLELGFGEGYVVQGGDVGSMVARVMAASCDAARAVHLNFCLMSRPEGVDDEQVDEAERRGVERTREFMQMGSSYAFEHATRPSTVGLVLACSPLALLAWIGEKFIAWSDEEPATGDILASVSLYWLTETFPRSIYPYRRLFAPGVVGVHEDPRWRIDKPFGYSLFPGELAPIPRAWVATTGRLEFYRRHESGGHFAAMERPEALLADVEALVDQVWKSEKTPLVSKT